MPPGRQEELRSVVSALPCPGRAGKLALIREGRLPAIEIDLSRIRYDGSPQEHADAVLRSAPRYWLFNRHADQAEDELRQQAVMRASEGDARRDKAWGKLAVDLVAADPCVVVAVGWMLHRRSLYARFAKKLMSCRLAPD